MFGSFRSCETVHCFFIGYVMSVLGDTRSINIKEAELLASALRYNYGKMFGGMTRKLPVPYTVIIFRYVWYGSLPIHLVIRYFTTGTYHITVFCVPDHYDSYLLDPDPSLFLKRY